MAVTNEVPAVVYPVGPSFRLGFILVGLWLSGALVALLWSIDQSAGSAVGAALFWKGICLCLSLILSGGTLWRFWKGLPTGTLAFDGDQWHFDTAVPGAQSNTRSSARSGLLAAAARVVVAADAQAFMLLRFPGAGENARWLWAESRDDTQGWHLLRCALYSPANQAVEGRDRPSLQA